jgi:hypothetical protein
VINWLIDRPSTQDGQVVAYFYCNGNLDDTQSVANILGNLMGQIVPSVDESGADMQVLKDLYKSARTRQGRGYLEKLLLAINNVVSSFSMVYLVIDGIDKCREREGLLQFLPQLSCQCCKVLATSRPEADIGAQWRGKRTLVMDSKNTREDIRKHLETRFRLDERMALSSPSVQKEITEALLKDNQES